MVIQPRSSLPWRLDAVMGRLCAGVKLNKARAVRLPSIVAILAPRHHGRYLEDAIA
jgi:hypothetical protein